MSEQTEGLLHISGLDGAIFSTNGRYRYLLRRALGGGDERVTFCMLNPSTATETRNDPTVRRCVGFASDWGFDVLDVVNLFAHRATDPNELKKQDDPVGPDNDGHIEANVAGASLIVVAWGNHGSHRARDHQVLDLLAPHRPRVKCFGVSKAGQPLHPLYQPKDAKLIPWRF